MNIENYNQAVTDELMSLLLTADPDKNSIYKYISDSAILVARDESNLIGVAVLKNESGQFELVNIAVKDNYQGRGIAKQLIAEIKLLAKSMGAKELLVGTGNSSLSQLALYQKCGFRIDHVETDYFSTYPMPIYENGIRCLDKIVLHIGL